MVTQIGNKIDPLIWSQVSRSIPGPLQSASMFHNQAKSPEGPLGGQTPFETNAIDPVVDHFITSKEKPSR